MAFRQRPSTPMAPRRPLPSQLPRDIDDVKRELSPEDWKLVEDYALKSYILGKRDGQVGRQRERERQNMRDAHDEARRKPAGPARIMYPTIDPELDPEAPAAVPAMEGEVLAAMLRPRRRPRQPLNPKNQV